MEPGTPSVLQHVKCTKTELFALAKDGLKTETAHQALTGLYADEHAAQIAKQCTTGFYGVALMYIDLGSIYLYWGPKIT